MTKKDQFHATGLRDLGNGTKRGIPEHGRRVWRFAGWQNRRVARARGRESGKLLVPWRRSSKIWCFLAIWGGKLIQATNFRPQNALRPWPPAPRDWPDCPERGNGPCISSPARPSWALPGLGSVTRWNSDPIPFTDHPRRSSSS